MSQTLIQIGKAKFTMWYCTVCLGKYFNGRKSIHLLDEFDNSPICIATVNMPHINLHEDEVLIKDYSENEGIYQALVDAKIISEEIKRIKTGYTEVILCKLLSN